ncbi:hypothetical protein T484DRAFT_1610561 [Baffinella frigidus]|nr:hypothetical protein T484DRAFT_1610561 [Cryptophyta sp. CCMP2293]
MTDVSGPAGPDGAKGVVLGEGERYDTKLTPGKIFVGGLSSDASEADVKEYFGAYGTIADVVVMRDKLTGTGRGFGFVTFADGNVADRVVSQRHEIKGRSVEAKSAVPRTEGEVQARQQGRGGGHDQGMDNQRSTKVFVGGLSPSVDDNDFKEYFGGYGRIVDSQVMVDPHSGKSRGFGFVTFDNADVVETVMMKRDHSIKGKTVEVCAQPPTSIRPTVGPKDLPRASYVLP